MLFCYNILLSQEKTRFQNTDLFKERWIGKCYEFRVFTSRTPLDELVVFMNTPERLQPQFGHPQNLTKFRFEEGTLLWEMNVVYDRSVIDVWFDISSQHCLTKQYNECADWPRLKGPSEGPRLQGGRLFPIVVGVCPLFAQDLPSFR